MLASLGHASPTEHAYFTFGIEGISRACSHQLVRHRIASYSQQSQRYVDGTRFDFVTPPEIAKNEKALAAYEKALKVEADAYKEIRDALAVGYINEKCPDKYIGTDEEIINAYKADDKNPAMLSSRKPTRTQDLFFRMHRQQKLSALSMQEACRTFLHTVAATERSGKFVRLPNRCFCNVLRLLRTFSKTAARHACSDHAPRAICVAESKRKCVRNTAEKSKVIYMKSKIIVIEGLDGSGKATQTKILCEKFSALGKKVTKLEFPNYESPAAAPVKMYLDGEFGDKPDDVNAYAASAFYAVDRVASYLQFWKKECDNGGVILSDRYVTSNIIYQMSKLPKEEWNSFIDWLNDFEYEKLGIPKPDLVIYLDVEPEVSQKLMEKRYGGDNSKKDLHEKTSVSFLTVEKVQFMPLKMRLEGY